MICDIIHKVKRFIGTSCRS